MKYRWDKKYLYWGVTAFCVIALSILFFYGVFYIDVIKRIFFKWLKIFMPIIYGLIMGYLLAPGVNYLEKKLLYPLFFKKCKFQKNSKMKRFIRGVSIFITLFAALLLVVSLVALLIPQLFSSISSLIVSFPDYYQKFLFGFRELFFRNLNLDSSVITNMDMTSVYIEEFLNQQILPKVNEFFNQFSFDVIEGVWIVSDLFIGIIVSIYVLNSKELFAAQFKKFIYAIFKPYRANIIIKDLRITNEMFSGFISGTLLDSFVIGIICFIGMMLMNMPYRVLVSVIIAVTNVIPFFGPYLGAIPSGLIILIVNPTKAIYFIVFIMILQTFEGNILSPKILGHSTGLSSFWVVVSILVGEGLFGIIGMFIGVPVFAIIYSLVKAHINRTLNASHLPSDTKEYAKLYYIDEESSAIIYDDNHKEEASKLPSKTEEEKEKKRIKKEKE